jgi:5-methylcytosine-specific restriction protein A
VKRGGPLNRGKPMKAGRPMARGTGIARTAPKRRPARDTGPTAATRRLVCVRWGFRCAACGISVIGRDWSIQHRSARGMGGTSDPAANAASNLILLCGSATSPGGCHLLCERRDPDMHGRGFWLWSWEDPKTVPVMVASEHGSGVTVWLDDLGGWSAAPPEGVAA